MLNGVVKDNGFAFPGSICTMVSALGCFVTGGGGTLIISFFTKSNAAVRTIGLLGSVSGNRHQYVVMAGGRISTSRTGTLSRGKCEPKSGR